jgi:acyl carrier protein
LNDANALLPTVERVYAEVRGAPRDLRPADSLRDDLGLDSLAAAELLTALEEELGLSLIEDERVPGVRTVGDVLAILTTAPRA